MPNESLQRAYNVSNSGFEQKINSVVGVFQNQQKTALAKQQMRQQMEMRKELAQYQSDLQFDKRKRIYEEIQKPQQEADALIQQQEKMRESFQTALTKSNEYRDDHINESFYRDHGFLKNVNFTPDVDPQTGIADMRIEVMNPNASEENRVQQIDYETYQRMRGKARNVSAKLNEWQSNVDRLAEGEEFISEQIGDRTIQVTKDNLPDIVRQAQNDPQTLDVLNQAIQQQQIAPVYAEETVQDRGAGVIAGMTELKLALGRSNTFNFDDKGDYELNPDMTAEAVHYDIQNFIEQDLGIDIHRLSSEQIDLALEGRKIHRRDEMFPDSDQRQAANKIVEQVQENKDNIYPLINLHRGIRRMYVDWAENYFRGDQVPPMNAVKLNLNVSPNDLSKLFVEPTLDWQGSHQKFDR